MNFILAIGAKLDVCREVDVVERLGTALLAHLVDPGRVALDVVDDNRVR